VTGLEEFSHSLIEASNTDHGGQESFQEVSIQGHRPLLSESLRRRAGARGKPFRP
jgi:hypothetical protein